MKLIDTHIHVWNLDQVDYPWLKGDTSILNRNYALEELEAGRVRAGVTAGVLVQAANSLADTEWMLGVAGANEWITGVVGWVPLEDPVETGSLLEEGWKGNGVRHLIHNEADAAWLLREPVLESLGLLAARDIPYDVVGVVPAHIRTALKVAERWPGLRMVFDHLNQPPGVGVAGSEWEELMKEAARHANFYCKISGLGEGNRERGIRFALTHFGPDRCFCGGDWPVSLLRDNYEQTWTAYRRIIEQYTDEVAREKVFWENAERFYRLH